jgi:hypothetical protein
MAANVFTVGASIGDGESWNWKSISSRHKIALEATDIKVELGVSNVPGGTTTINKALKALEKLGKVYKFELGTLGSSPKLFCRPEKKIMQEIRASGTTDNKFVNELREELRNLLDKFGKQAKKTD